MGSKQLSPTEWDIMRVLWDAEKATVNEMAVHLADSKSWHPKTIRTMLSRLEKKGIIKRNSEDSVYTYTPLIAKEECVGQASDQFINRVFDGALAPMAAHFVQQRSLTPDERAELKRILDEETSDE
ncbi:MAG TPA: BlaI/MecI/CopY family transcriptional regulator [Candidatus Hydrogenedentes bacterium]|nr:BlaI/MecI/CopY family transcriptional regulator [Candidatus Hydrogenedentota bacterium]